MVKCRAFSVIEFIMAICVLIAVVVLISPFFNKLSKAERTALTLKDVYETINSTVERYEQYDEPCQTWGWSVSDTYEISKYILDKYIVPSFSNYTSCSNPLLCVGGFLSMDGEDYTNYRQREDYVRALVGKKKVHIALRSTGSCVMGAADNLCGILVVDVDNKDGENKLGYDVFVFGFYGDGKFMPFGYNFSKEDIEKNCSKYSYGETCAAKIMNNNWVMNELSKEEDYFE